MRLVVLTIALLFIAMLSVLTALDFIHYGVTVLGVVAVLIIVLFMVGIVGALRPPPKRCASWGSCNRRGRGAPPS